MVCVLLEGNANTEYIGDFSVSPLVQAIREGNNKIIDKLISHGADVKSRNAKYGSLPINNTVIQGSINIARILKVNGCPLNCTNDNGWTPLHFSACHGHIAMTKWLVQQGIEVGAVNFNDENAADIAQSYRHHELATWLLDQLTASPETKNQEICIAEMVQDSGPTHSHLKLSMRTL